MLWKLFKTNWFSIALICLVLLAVARKGLHLFVGGAGSPGRKDKTEKYTEVEPKPAAKSLLGLFSASDKGAGQLPEISHEEAKAFLRRFTSVAVSERKKFGTPASVLLACAYVNSYAGQRSSVAAANNYFALPGGSDWEGANTTVGGRSFRRYETPWESFRDFSIHLSSQDWFGSLRKSAGKDWRAWAKGLHAEDISDVKNFEQELVQVIETYRLFELDVP